MPVPPPRESSENSPARFSHIGGSNGNPGNVLWRRRLAGVFATRAAQKNKLRDAGATKKAVFIAGPMAWVPPMGIVVRNEAYSDDTKRKYAEVQRGEGIEPRGWLVRTILKM